MVAQSYNRQVVESRVDWLTMTAAGAQERIALGDLAQATVRALKLAGDDVKPWAHWGYTGFGTRHVHWGERPDTDVLVLSGAIADDLLADVVPLASHISRLDTCVTVRLPDDVGDIIRQGFESGRHHPFRSGHKPSFEILEHSEKGSTLYVGSRQSRAFGRLYNKHRESELDFYAGCYRYEVEQKNDLAEHRAHRLAADPDRGGTVRGDVYSFFSKRGVPPEFDLGDGRLSGTPYRPHSDDRRRLYWLGGQVKRTVDRLVEDGYRQDVLDALGLSNSTGTLDTPPKVD